jgi:N-acetylated-alpha-linked acidic dipeptidase
MADTDVLPYDYVTYAREISTYLVTARKKANEYKLGGVDFTPAETAATHLGSAGQRIRAVQMAPPVNPVKVNGALRNAESALITEAGLPNRPWYKHTIYAPGEYTGYAAVVIPGVNEAIEAKDASRTRQQLAVLAEALNRAAQTLSNPQ